MSNLKKIFYLLTKKEKYNLTVISVFNFIGILLEMLSFAIIIPVFNVIFLNQKSENSFFNNIFNVFNFFGDSLESNNFKILILLILIFLFCFKNIFLIIINYVSIKFYNFLQLRISNSLFELYLKQDYSFFLGNKSDFLVRKLINDTMGVKTYLNLLQNSVIDILLVFSFSLVLIYANFQIFVFCALFFSLVLFIYFAYVKNKIVSWSYLYQNNLGTLQNTIIDGSRGIKDLTIYNLKDSFLKKFFIFNKNTFFSHFKIDFINNVQRFWMEIVAITAMMIPLIFFLFLKKDVNQLIPIFALFFVGLFKIIPTFNRIIQSYQILKFNKPSLNIIYQQFSELKSVEDSKAKIEFNSNLVFSNVGHIYESNQYEVFNNINLKIYKNESIAIIGPNGSGKSTLLNFLSGLIKPSKGKVLIDNLYNIFDFKENWIKKISYVQQNIFLLNSSIKKNITFEDDKNLNIEKYGRVKEILNLESIFSNLPNGLDTIVGNDGLNLSGGQKQIVSIARALYKDSEIIIFDEANSALDIELIKILKKIISILKGNKTVIFITHDLSFLKDSFDKIYRIESGKIIQQ